MFYPAVNTPGIGPISPSSQAGSLLVDPPVIPKGRASDARNPLVFRNHDLEDYVRGHTDFGGRPKQVPSLSSSSSCGK